jgi:hypothetical protein
MDGIRRVHGATYLHRRNLKEVAMLKTLTFTMLTMLVAVFDYALLTLGVPPTTAMIITGVLGFVGVATATWFILRK